MSSSKHYVVLLKKGPNWTATPSPELEELQKRHLAHLAKMGELGYLIFAGPTEDHGDGRLRGVCIYQMEQVGALDRLRELVEADPMIQIGRLVAEYATWYLPVQARFIFESAR